MASEYHSEHNPRDGQRITPLELMRVSYRMNGILIEFGVDSYVELQEKYPDVFRRFVNSLPELTEEEKERGRRKGQEGVDQLYRED